MKEMIEQELQSQVDGIQTISRWKPYRSYKDSGIEWLGRIPEHWDARRLKYAAPFSRKKLLVKPDELLYVGLEQIEAHTGKLQIDTPIDIVESVVNVFDKGHVLFGKLRPYLAKVLLADFRGVCTSELLVLDPTEILISKYLFYRLLSNDFINFVNSLTYGTKMPRASGEQIGNIAIQVPSLSEQQAITSFLDIETAKIDALIAKRERMIEILQERRTAVINQAVTRGLNPDVKMKDSGVEWLGEIPVHWDHRQFKYLAEISYGLTLELDRTETEGHFIISLPNVTKEGQLLLDDVPLTPLKNLSNKEKQSLLLKKGDLLFNWRNGSLDHVGKTAYFDANGEYFHVSFLLRIRFDIEKYDPRYYHMLINNLRSTGFFAASKSRVNNTYNQTELKRLDVIVPPLAEQKAVASYLDQETTKIDKLIAGIQQSIQKLKEYSTALISAAVTGKIDVRDEINIVHAESVEDVV